MLLAFVTMTGNFSGVPLAFAFIIILGINGALTLLLKSWGPHRRLQPLLGVGSPHLHLFPDPAGPAAALPGVRRAAG